MIESITTIESLIVPIISIGGLSLVFGALLGFSAKKFAVQVDPKVEKIRNILPGVNCGGCGFAGCAGFAEAVAKEEASYRGCPAGGSAAATAIAETIGINPSVSDRKVAFIKCNGVDDNIKRNYIYDGPRSCVAASQLATGGNKSCSYSCIGLASCKNACPFNAIKIVDSIAEVDSKKCTACGKCVTVCPMHLIEIIPEKSKVRVLCNSRDKGRVVRKNCRAGCIGCALCQKACEAGAITIEDNIARIDYTKCTLCMKCVNKCPSKTIAVMP
ncbi:MAG: RnfABCDGE type electron transport complex subunit B [Treponema sp.]|jgi:Na+-translocating ferredoxin:NAD+ oxidoreductase RNF subunit RnfB|nr:RnfABCDGE type electron transport complex subunit B [Treponema sp.]